jgi:hypothetical protein
VGDWHVAICTPGNPVHVVINLFQLRPIRQLVLNRTGTNMKNGTVIKSD